MRWSSPFAAGCLLCAGTFSGACHSSHAVPEQPTWADVEPIVRGACTQCHGSNAKVAGSFGGGTYRFDFYDMTDAVCGEAAEALRGNALGMAWAAMMAADVTPPGSGWRSRMPPSPGDQLTDWQRETVIRWARKPVRGTASPENHRPDIELVGLPPTADGSLKLTAIVSDGDGEPVVGVLKVGDTRLLMDRSGSFSATVDTSAWATGKRSLSATLCDGWSNVTVDLGSVTIAHAPVVDAAASTTTEGGLSEAPTPDTGDADSSGPTDGAAPEGPSSDAPSTDQHE
jgi:hypothetical protein